MRKKNQLKMSKIQDFISKRNLFFWSLSISSWASFATWLHLEALPENTKIINKYWLSNIELNLIHTILELGKLGIAKKLLVSFVTLCKKIQFFKKLTAQGLLETQSTIIWLIEILRVKKKSFATPLWS